MHGNTLCNADSTMKKKSERLALSNRVSRAYFRDSPLWRLILYPSRHKDIFGCIFVTDFTSDYFLEPRNGAELRVERG